MKRHKNQDDNPKVSPRSLLVGYVDSLVFSETKATNNL